MASNIYTRHTIEGAKVYTRAGTQGRHKLPPELLKIKLSARISMQTKERIKEQSNKYNMTESAYCDLALSLFDIDVFVGRELVKS